MAKDWTPEAAAAAVRIIYKRILERDVDDSGLINWAGALDRAELSVKEIVRLVGKSAEYRNRFVLPFAPTKAIEKMYEHFLARNPESSNVVDGWAETLVLKGFEIVVDGFVDSQEYGRRFGDDSVPA
jgi:hypothetical protein